MSKEIYRTQVRVPEELFEKARVLASIYGVSFNQLVHLLMTDTPGKLHVDSNASSICISLATSSEGTGKRDLVMSPDRWPAPGTGSAAPRQRAPPGLGARAPSHPRNQKNSLLESRFYPKNSGGLTLHRFHAPRPASS